MAIFSAVGIGGKANQDGTITVRAQIVHNGTKKVITTLSVDGVSIDEITRKLQADVDRREAAETDATINTHVAGAILVTSRTPAEVAAAGVLSPGEKV